VKGGVVCGEARELVWSLDGFGGKRGEEETRRKVNSGVDGLLSDMQESVDCDVS